MIQESVVMPAQEHAVIGVCWAAVGVLCDVMDFAPCGRDGASGDDASAVAEGDRAALVAIEDSLFGSDGNGSAFASCRHSLHGA